MMVMCASVHDGVPGSGAKTLQEIKMYLLGSKV